MDYNQYKNLRRGALREIERLTGIGVQVEPVPQEDNSDDVRDIKIKAPIGKESFLLFKSVVNTVLFDFGHLEPSNKGEISLRPMPSPEPEDSEHTELQFRDVNALR